MQLLLDRLRLNAPARKFASVLIVNWRFGVETPTAIILQVRHLFDQAPELDLADFYIRNDKFVDAEAVLASFTRELKDKVPEEEWIWFRTRALVVRLKMRQLLWGAAVSAGKEALEPLHVRT
jgi:hypothetical protein